MEVTYDTDQPESTFNLELLPVGPIAVGRSGQGAGRIVAEPVHEPGCGELRAGRAYPELPARHRQGRAPVTADPAFSQSGRPIDMAAATFQPPGAGIVTAASNQFEISVGGSRYVTVTVPLAGITTKPR